MSLTEKIKEQLDNPKIESTINRIAESTEPPILKDMILFAEYLERKHNRGFVVYFSKACHQFTVCNWDEWQEECDKPWNGHAQWHTSKCTEQ